MNLKIVLMLVILMALIIFDSESKGWMLNRPSSIQWGFLKLDTIYNRGFFLGYFENISTRNKEVIFVTLGLFVSFYYLFFLLFFSGGSLLTSFGATFFTAGVLGNLIDRMNHQSVLDFITFDFPFHLPFFNLADLFQWIGVFLLTFGITKDFRMYWPQVELRKKFLTNFRLQMKIALVTTLPIIFSNILLIVFSFYFFKDSENSIALKFYLILGILISSTFISLTFLLSVFLSNRISGPIHALRRHLRGLEQGQIEELKLRENDEFKELEDDFNRLVSKIKTIKSN